MKYYGMIALLTLISHLTFILLVFSSLQGLRLDRLIERKRQKSFKIILVLASLALGYMCSEFFLSFFDNMRNLGYLLK